MMFNRKLISVSIASALLASSLAVSANTNDDEEKDSVNGWGKWSKNYATAAGGEFNTGALAFASLGQADTGRNAQNEPGFEQGGCAAGSFCGFTAFRHVQEPVVIDGPNMEGPHPMMMGYGGPINEVGYFDLKVSPTFFYEGDQQNPSGPMPMYYMSGGSTTGAFAVNGVDGTAYSVDGAEGYHYSSSGHLNKEGSHVNYHRVSESMLSGNWSIGNGMYMYMMPTMNSFVGGVTTSLADLNALTAGSVVASYAGHTFDSGSFGMTINFGSKTWAGEFAGQNGFDVNGGTINGVNFSADSANLSAQGATVTGTVNGAVFGAGAAEVGGMIDIEKDFGGGMILDRKTVFASSLNDA